MKNILLTGGSGFIGRNILESFLAEKYRIIAPRHSELELTDDGVVRDFFKKEKIDVVVHSAVKPGHRNAKDPTNLFYTDSRMFFNIVRNAGFYDKLIVLSSGSVYDMARQDLHKVSEDYFDALVPLDEHGFFRYMSARFMEHMDKAVELRIFGIFGKYEDYAIRFISNAACKAVFGLPITLRQNRLFDYIYIDDLMPALDHFIENAASHKAYNITPDESHELLGLAGIVREVSGKDLPILVDREGMGLEYAGDNSRLRAEVPGLSFTPVEEAIRRLYAWYSENKHLINRGYLLKDK